APRPQGRARHARRRAGAPGREPPARLAGLRRDAVEDGLAAEAAVPRHQGRGGPRERRPWRSITSDGGREEEQEREGREGREGAEGREAADQAREVRQAGQERGRNRRRGDDG